jgi:hypothetical protein
MSQLPSRNQGGSTTKVDLPAEIIDLLMDATMVSNLLKTKNIILDGHSIRGEFEKASFFIMPFPSIQDWEFGGIGINRPQEFIKRVQLMKQLGDNIKVSAEVKTRDDHTFVTMLNISQGKSKASFKCADHARLRAPKSFNNPELFGFSIKTQDVTFIQSAQSSMGAESIKIVADKDEVSFVIVSKDGTESATHGLDGDLQIHQEGFDKFEKTYATETLVAAIKALSTFLKREKIETADITLTERGVVKLEVKGMVAHIFPNA